MHTKTRLLIASLLTLGAGAVASPAAARPAPPDLSGVYVIDRSVSDDPQKAMEQATSSRRRFRRNAVSRRLPDDMKTADTLRITQHGDSVTLWTSEKRRATVVPGEAKSRTGQRGNTVETVGEWDGSALVVRTKAEQFQREARYSLEEDGSRLRVAISMRGERLSGPVSYSLVYRRVSDAPASD